MKKEKEIKQNQPEQKKSVRIAKTIINTVINILIVIVLLTSILVATLALTSKANEGVPSIFGYSFHTVQSPSMEGGSDKYEGGDYHIGDLVIGKATHGNPNEVYEVGDIIVYKNNDEQVPFITHRVVAVEKNDSGVYQYTTKGDNNALEDADPHTAADVVSVCYDHDYHGAVLKGWGKTLDFLRTGQGFFFVVLLPMIIFFLYEIVRVVLNTLNYKKSKAAEEKEDAERDKQEAIDAAVKAALASVNAAQGNNGAENESLPLEGEAPDPVGEPAVTDAAAPEMSAEDYEEFKRFMAFKKAQDSEQKSEDGE